jgi:hypothetical protein
VTRNRVVVAFLALAVGGCGSVAPPSPAPTTTKASASATTVAPASSSAPVPSPSPSPSGPLDRIAGWSADIDAILDARDHVHPAGWHGMPRADWVAAADGAKRRLAQLTDDQALVELVRLAAMPSWNGRDGHSGIFPFIPGTATHEYPIRWWRFPEGLVITAVRSGVDPTLVGQRVTAIGGHPIDDVLDLVDPLAPRDNPSNLLAYGPLYARCAELLVGLGVVPDVGPATFRVGSPSGGPERDVRLEPITPEADLAWNSGQPMRLPPTDAPWLARQDEAFWWTALEDSGTLYLQQNEVSGGIGEQTRAARIRFQAGGISRVVLDLRHNGGGDNTTLLALEELLRDPEIDRPGRLFVVTSRNTFSAAANLATDLERDTSAIFVGEAMGGSPNLYGDARRSDLPYGPWSLFTATRYWERSAPDDEGLTIEPDLFAELTAADYFAGRDPALQTILDTPIAPG